MAIPRVFISSTCYDLKYIRENLKYFINTLGYDPVLSEEGAVYYDPTLDTQDSCLREIPSCQMFVLVIGGRFGGAYKDTEDSITNNEYREAIKSKIPVFALVDSSVHSDYLVYQKNRDNPDIDENKITYPSVDSTKIFSFIEEVRTNSVNNALNPFSDFADIESYLRQQWAGMMFSFLIRQSKEAKLMSELYDVMKDSECLRDLASVFKLKPTPRDILRNETFADCMASLGKALRVVNTDAGEFILCGDLTIALYKVKSDSNEYHRLRKEMLRILSNLSISLEDFLNR